MRIASHASSLACSKEDYSWVLQREERIKEASRNSTVGCEERLLCYNNADSMTHNDIAIRLGLEH